MFAGLDSPVRSVVTVALLLTASFLGAWAGAVPVAAGASVPVVLADSWAFGAEKWFNLSVSTPQGIHVIQAFMGWYSIFERTNVSSTVTQLSVENTVVSNFSAQYCSPDCSSPQVNVILQHATYEHVLGYLNLTRAGTVYEGGTAVPAIALLDSSASANGWARSSADITVVTPQGTKHATESFSAQGQAAASLAFSPALGLIPLTLNLGDTWNATSAYTGSGAWSVGWTYEKTNASGATVVISGTPSGSLNATGEVSVEGTVVGSMPLPGGVVVPTVLLSFSSDLEVLDGMIILPRGAGFFDGAVQPWDQYRLGFASLQMHQLGVQYNPVSGSFRLVAATGLYGTSDTSVSMGDQMRASVGVGMTPSVVNSTPGVTATEVAATPVSVADAETATACFSTGASCGATAPASSGSGDFTWVYLAIGIAAVLIVVAASGYLVLSRRRP